MQEVTRAPSVGGSSRGLSFEGALRRNLELVHQKYAKLEIGGKGTVP